MTGYQIAFIAAALITIVSAVLVVTVRNILRAALFLAFAFLGVAALYVLANAELLAAMQVLIYVGAITVLIMFAIVLTQQLMGAKLTQVTRVKAALIALAASGATFAFIVKTFVIPFKSANSAILSSPKPSDAGVLRQIAELLLQPYVVAFELASLVLLAALVGAIVISKEDRD